MLAVKLVVHGLVEFIQNYSKKNHDAPQVGKTNETKKLHARPGIREVHASSCFSLGSFPTALKQKSHGYGPPSVRRCPYLF